MSEEARAEVHEYFNSIHAYMDADGSLHSDPYVDSVERVLKNSTGLFKP